MPSLIILGSLIVFFIYNINNKVFLGNSGLNVLSVVLSFFTINVYNINSELARKKYFFIFILFRFMVLLVEL